MAHRSVSLRARLLGCSFLFVAVAVLAQPRDVHASFYTHLVQIGGGGSDTTVDDVAEAEALLDGSFAGYEILADATAIRAVIDLGTEGDYALDLLYPDGTTGDSAGGPFSKEQFAVRARATLTIPAGDWTIAFGSDAGGRLALAGVTFTAELNTLGDAGLDDSIVYDGVRNHDQTLGQFTLASETTLELDASFFETTGADGFEISIASGHLAVHDAVSFELLQDGTLGIAVAPTPEDLLSGDAAANDRLGYAVAIDGDLAVVGAYLDDDGGNESGSAYVFERSGTGWVERAKLVPGDAAANDRFGLSVAISGDTIVVGAYRKPTNFTGAAYVFVEPAGGWAGTLTHDAKLVASDAAAASEFGFAVDVSGDHVVIGSPTFDGFALNAGQAYVFERPVAGWAGTLTEDAMLRSSGLLASDNFGSDVAVADGTVVVGAKFEDSAGANAGAAYVFLEPGGGWAGAGALTEDARLTASDQFVGDQFGFAVAIDGGTIVVGATMDDDNGAQSGAAYVFVEPGGGWSGALTEDAKLVASDGASTDNLGHALSISGRVVVAGAPFKHAAGNDHGAAYVFVEPIGGWAGTLGETRKLVDAGGLADDEFGFSVSVESDTAIVGAPETGTGRTGKAFVFRLENSVLDLCAGVDCSPFDDVCSVASCNPNNGMCDVFDPRPAGTLCRAGSGDVCDPDEFCDGVALSCPADTFEPATTVCNAGSGDLCDPDEMCLGVAGAACPADTIASAGTVCLAGSGDLCDPDEVCSGVADAACPADTFEPATTVCNPGSGDLCDPDEMCLGVAGAACPADSVAAAGTVCLAGSGDLCDPDEVCSGLPDLACPADAFEPATTVCNPGSGDLCDPDEMCLGVAGAACPADTIASAGTVCLAGSGDLCDPDEVCSGVADAACPADTFEPATTVCNPGSGDLCDPDEMCLGVAGAACPADTIASAGTVCLVGSGDLCDPDEVCSGVADAACPADTFEPATTVCNPGSGDLCDPDEMCLGVAGAACPADTIASAGTVCLAGSGDLCDPDEVCSGVADAACPADTFEPATTVCNPGSGDLCDPDEFCVGIAGAACPADVFADASTVCNASSTGDETCDPSEFCAGAPDVACPADFIAPLASACGDPSETACTLPDSCDGAGTCLINNQACGLLSDQSLCVFDVLAEKGECVDGGVPTGEGCDLASPACSVGTCVQSRQFELAFTPDEQNAPAFELSSTSPRHFFYNIMYDGPFPASLTVTVPYPFVTQGTTPVHVYDGALVASQDSCLVQPDPIAFGTQRVAMGDYLGLATNPGVTCDLVCDPSGATAAMGTCFGGSEDGLACEVGDPGDACVVGGGGCAPSGSCSFEVALDDPGSGLAYVNVLLDYGLEGRSVDANPCDDGLVDRYEPGDWDYAFRGRDALVSPPGVGGPLGIANFTAYRFAHHDGLTGLSDTVQNHSQFGFSQVDTLVSYAVEGGQPSSLTFAGGAVTVRPADALNLELAVLAFAELPDSPIEDVDALHVTPEGRVIFSTTTDVTQGFGGLASFRNGDLVEWDPETGLASVVFDADLFDVPRNVDAVSRLPNGNWLLSTSLSATLGGLTFENGDIVEYDPLADVATLYEGLSEAALFTGSNPDVDGLHRLDDGSLLISVRTNGVGRIGSNFGFESADETATDVFVYDPATDLAMRYLDGADLFDDPDGAGSLRGTRNLDALFVPEPGVLWGLVAGGLWLCGAGRRRGRAGNPTVFDGRGDRLASPRR